MSARGQGFGFSKHAVLCGALLDAEVTNQFVDVAYLYFLVLRERRVDQGSPGYSPEVIGYPNRMSWSAVGEHPLDIGEVFRCRHLCGLLVSYRIGDLHIVTCCERFDFAVQTLNFNSCWPRIWRLSR